jgi:hypothetical protein
MIEWLSNVDTGVVYAIMFMIFIVSIGLGALLLAEKY